MFRWIRGLFRWFSGFFGGKADDLQSNTNVIRATFDAADAAKVKSFTEVKNAVAMLMGIKEQRVVEIKGLNERLTKLTQIQAGSANKAKSLTFQLKGQGVAPDQIKTNADFVKCMSAYQDSSNSIAEIEKSIAEKETELAQRDKQIATYKVQLQEMQRAVQKLREEKQETIADVEASKQTDQINSVLAGIAHDTTDQDLIAVRQARQRAKAKAAISAELVGNDAKLAEDEYIQYAANTEHADAFAKLVGLDEEKATEEPILNPAKLPE